MSSTFFQDRLAPLVEYATEEGVPFIPPVAAEMRAVDEEIEQKVAALREVWAPATVEEVAEVGRLVAAGELTPAAAKKKLEGFGSRGLPGASGHSRVAIAVDAARKAYQAAADKPEYAPAALRKAALPVLGAELASRMGELVEAWDAAPAAVHEELEGAQFMRFDSLMGQVDITEIPGAELEARRRIMAAWDAVEHFAYDHAIQWLMGVNRRGQWEIPQEFLPDREAVVLGEQGCALIAAGFNLEELIIAGRGEELVAVIADPYGADSEAYQERMAARKAVEAWRFKFNDYAEMGIPFGGRDNRAALQRRKELRPAQVVAEMREEGVWQW
ncbi:hypothetical protein MHT86_08485 [Corynebacterium mastitidis]|uniref:hypothetical protein n=1 Tax=Corynebacterium mastitidis TaxID=161890 RepID=UPI001F13BADD|nr:hypothetical protein [Corynebacterium mastitidis]MCH6197531.1 hypothetical protein [Corynebacterium mastitidis]